MHVNIVWQVESQNGPEFHLVAINSLYYFLTWKADRTDDYIGFSLDYVVLYDSVVTDGRRFSHGFKEETAIL